MSGKYLVRLEDLIKKAGSGGGESSTSPFSPDEEIKEEKYEIPEESEETVLPVRDDVNGNNDGVGASRTLRRRIQVIRVVVNTDEPKSSNQTETHKVRRKPAKETRKEEPTTRVLRPIKPKPVPPEEEGELVEEAILPDRKSISKPRAKRIRNLSEDAKERKRERERARRHVRTPEQKRAHAERERYRRQMLKLAAEAARDKEEVGQAPSAEVEQLKRIYERQRERGRTRRRERTQEQKKADAERQRCRRQMLKLATAAAREKGDGKLGQVSAAEIEQFKRNMERDALRQRERRVLLKLAAVAKKELQSGGLEDPTKLIKSFKNTELETLRAEFEKRGLASAKQKEKLEIEEEVAMALVKSMSKDEIDRLSEEYERMKMKDRERVKRMERDKLKKKDNLKLKKKDNLPTMTRQEHQLERWYCAALARRRKMSPEQLAQPDPKFDELESTRFKAKELRRQRKYNLPEMTEEERKKWIEEEKEKVERNRTMHLKRREKMTNEKKEQLRIRNYMWKASRSAYYKQPDDVKEARIAWGRQWRHSLTGEKLERYRNSLRRSAKKRQEKMKQDPELAQKFKDKMNARSRMITQNETAEERQKRLLRYRLYQSRKLMGNKLKEEGLPEEEIQDRLQDYTENFYMEHPITRPLPKGSKRTLGLGAVNYQGSVTGLSHLPDLSNILSRVSASTWSTEMTTTSPPPHVSSGEAKDDDDDTDPLDKDVEEETSVQISPVPSPTPSFDDHHDPLDDPVQQDDDFDDENGIREDNLVSDHPNSLDEEEHEGDALTSTQVRVQQISKDLPVVVPREIRNEEGIRGDDDTDPVELPSNSQRPKRKRAISKTCEDCGKVFKYHSSYITHMRQVHLDPRKCPHPQCDFQYREGPQLWAHFRTIHVQSEVAVECVEGDKPEPKSRKCSHADCDFLYTHRKTLWSHVRQVHLKDGDAPASLNQAGIENGSNSTKDRPKSKEPSMCPECGKTFKKKCTLDDHIRRFHEGKGYFCDICDNGSDLQSVAKLWRHKVVKHGMSDLEPPPNIEMITCEFCGEKILRGYAQHVLKKHPEMKDRLPASPSPAMGGPTTPGVVKCPECSKEIGKYQLRRHLAWVHGVGEQKRFPCSNCGIKFKQRNHMEQHFPSCLAKNGDKVGLEDPSSSSNDQEHVSQTGVPLLDPGLHTTCHVCSKTLRVESLTAHLRRIHGIGRQISFPCPYCGKCFKENWSMNLHSVRCNAKSNMGREQELNNNPRMRRRPFSCVLCGGKFAKRNDLRQHVVATHPKEYESIENPDLSKIPLECKDCSERFSDLDQLREHLESSHPDKCLKCPECEKVMLSSVELAFHISLGHNKVRDAKEKRMKATGKSIAPSPRRKSSAGGRLGRRRRGRKRRAEDSDDGSDEDQLQKVVVRTPTLPVRRSLRNRGSKRNLTSVITPPCFVRLKRMSNEEIVSYLFTK